MRSGVATGTYSQLLARLPMRTNRRKQERPPKKTDDELSGVNRLYRMSTQLRIKTTLQCRFNYNHHLVSEL
jgi:hypothetical protein